MPANQTIFTLLKGGWWARPWISAGQAKSWRFRKATLRALTSWTAELDEALVLQTAAATPKTLNQSACDLDAAQNTLIESAHRLCSALTGLLVARLNGEIRLKRTDQLCGQIKTISELGQGLTFPF